MTWALGLPENMSDNELADFIRGHAGSCACEGCREYETRMNIGF